MSLANLWDFSIPANASNAFFKSGFWTRPIIYVKCQVKCGKGTPSFLCEFANGRQFQKVICLQHCSINVYLFSNMVFALAQIFHQFSSGIPRYETAFLMRFCWWTTISESILVFGTLPLMLECFQMLSLGSPNCCYPTSITVSVVSPSHCVFGCYTRIWFTNQQAVGFSTKI